MKRIVSIALCLVLLLSIVPVSAEGDCAVSGHDFAEASCTAPKTCKVCGEEEGEPLGHDWKEAHCYGAKICLRCFVEEGEPRKHELLPADCVKPKHCKHCGYEEGKALGHTMGDYTCGQDWKCVVCSYVGEKNVQHYYENEWNDTCKRCGHVRKVEYDYIIEVGEELVIKHGSEWLIDYRSSDTSILERIALLDCLDPSYKYCVQGVFVAHKAGEVRICDTYEDFALKTWFVKVVESDKPITKPTTTTTKKPTTTTTTTKKPTTTTTTTKKPTTTTKAVTTKKTTATTKVEDIPVPTTENTTVPTTEAIVSTTESTTVPTTEAVVSTTAPTTEPTTAVVAEPMPKKPNVWPFIGGGALLIVGVAVAIILMRKKK